MKIDYTKGIPLLISVLTLLHYYMSFIWLYKFLEIYGLQMSGIIVIQDVLFHFADHNLFIIKMSFLGYLLVFLYKLVLPSSTYNSLHKIAIIEGKASLKAIISIFKMIKKKWVRIVTTGIIIILLIVSIFYVFSIDRGIPISNLVLIFLILLIILPSCYLLFVPKRLEIIFLTFITMIFFFHKVVDYTINESINSKDRSQVEISFQYEGGEIKTTNEKVLLYEGYKYILMVNPKNGETFKYETNQVTHVKRKRVIPSCTP